MRAPSIALLAIYLFSLSLDQAKIGGTSKVGGTVKTSVATGGGSTLNNDVVAFWKLEEASGTRDDAVSTNNLTDNGTTGSTTGKIGDAASFTQTPSSNYLRIADNAALSITSSVTVACWVRISSSMTVDFPGFAAKWGAGQRSYSLRYDRTASRFLFSVSSDGAAFTTVTANTFGAPSTGVFYFVVGYFDDSNDLIGISVNDGTPDTTSFTSTLFDGTADFEIGHLGTSGNTLFGEVDAAGIWSRKLTSAEITELYNSGTGKEYPF